MYWDSFVAETTETEITTTEIIKRRDVGLYGIRSEYCIRKIICPIGVPEAPKGWFVCLFRHFPPPCNLEKLR